MLTVVEQIFIFSAVAFNLLISAIFVAQKYGKQKLVRVFGLLWLSLLVPFAVTFVLFQQQKRESWILVSLLLVFLYMLVELLLDYVFKYDFRARHVTHVPYIILEYIALFSLIWVSFEISQFWGTIVAICFWILIGSLIYLYWDKIFRKK